MSEDINNTQQPPFNVGDAVKMRASALSLRKFRHMIKDDIGIVIDIKRSTKKSENWLVTIHWQQYINTANGKKQTSYFHTRLKLATKKTRKQK